MGIMLLAVFAATGAGGNANGGKQNSGEPSWRFAVSGDSRDCGNVVMPAIAAAVR